MSASGAAPAAGRRIAARRLRRCVATLAAVPAGVFAAALDPDTGLVRQPGWEDVRTHCGACHSYRIVTNQRGSREDWRNMIRRMQRAENLWELPNGAETRILDYLSAHYPAENHPADAARQRRLPIPPEHMPPPGGG